MKVVINRCFGGFGLSLKATAELAKVWPEIVLTPVADYYSPLNKGRLEEALDEWRAYKAEGRTHEEAFLTQFSDDGQFIIYLSDRSDPDVRRDPRLVEIVERLGEAANGRFAKLEIVEIPDDVDFEIEDYDGQESIHEKHRSW